MPGGVTLIRQIAFMKRSLEHGHLGLLRRLLFALKRAKRIAQAFRPG
jgi:hypothetical protein